ncbi:ATP-binding protein [Rhodopirellula sp. MGV]|uniref:hybrid sensor histidine kinase/response regulator n=1 Tax=Rhodopirellula sp. MGV TaxID=2023130 RepID=UPI000B97A057|nr:ATP-binding protein [Rhodopirellula sp. MGV]OYP38408.1 hypothetical protein CGZ80_02370 [Rhodopirellula sp. MGV]PNY34173.1 hypothetical protein C2E31_24460 [Rhodopirellula baltica]
MPMFAISRQTITTNLAPRRQTGFAPAGAIHWLAIAFSLILSPLGLSSIASAHDTDPHDHLTPPATQAVVEQAEAGELLITDLRQATRLYDHPTLKSVPVDFKATVNYWDIRDTDIFVEDQFDALYLEAPPEYFRQHQRLPPGTQIRIRGQLKIDHFFVVADEIEILDEPLQISSRAVHISELNVGELWSHYVRTHGKLREIIHVGSLWQGLCTSRNADFVIQRRDESHYFEWERLLNRTVEISGTLSCEMDTDWNPTRYIFFTNEEDPPLRSAGESSFQSALQLPTMPTSYADARQAPAGTSLYHLNGQIVEVVPKKHYLIERNGESIVVDSAIIDASLVGNLVDAYVYKTGPHEFQSVYVAAHGKRRLMPPSTTNIKTIDLPELPMRAKLTGTYISTHRDGDNTYITLRDQGIDFVAKLDSATSDVRNLDLPTAQLISVTGLAVPISDKDVAPNEDVQPFLAIEVPTIDDIHVVSRWWQFSPSIAVAGLGTIATICTLGMVCFATLWLRLQRTANDNRQLQSQLVQSQKLDALGRLTSGVAHDFNNLLTGISSNLELIERAENTHSGNSIECLHSAKRCTHQATKLVRSLLGFSRQTNVELLPGDINEIVEETVLLARSTFSPDIKIITTLAPNLPACRFDHTQLGQVLLNLCFNAKDAYEDDAGTIRLVTKFAHSPNRPGSIIIQCQDDGMGMDEETQSRIFEPFFTTKKVGEGTGLGLSLAYGIIKQHGGEIECVSQPDAGTTFTIELPVEDIRAKSLDGESFVAKPHKRHTAPLSSAIASAIPPAANLANSPASITEETTAPFHILLVDDDEEVRRVATLSFETLGHHVTAVGCGTDAIQKLVDGLTPDVVILDLIMPLVSGSETLERIKQYQPDLPVVICSGVVNEVQQRLQDCAYRPDACIAKPFRLADLNATLHQVCSDQGQRNPHSQGKSQGKLQGQDKIEAAASRSPP